MAYNESYIKQQPVCLLGIGGVGRALLQQISAARQLHATRNRVHLSVVGVADSRGVYVKPEGLSDTELESLAQTKISTGRLGVAQTPTTVDTLTALLPRGTIVVDTSATDETVPVLLAAHQDGWGVVLANKLPLAGEMAWFDAISTTPARWETTVGAAMPVISTLNALLDSGDVIERIEGSLSGTLGFIAAQLEAGVPFGAAVREAKARGYTEPDPRQDLGGLDAARKALIMARMLGYRLEMSDAQVESLYPQDMNNLSVEQFLVEVDSLDAAMAARAAELTVGGKKLRYAALVENGSCKVQLTGADPQSKLGGIRTSDSIVVFSTRFYHDNPLAISGRGAGQEVTASGVLGDIISLAREMR